MPVRSGIGSDQEKTYHLKQLNDWDILYVDITFSIRIKSLWVPLRRFC